MTFNAVDLIGGKETEFVSFKQDPLALACCLKRINKPFYPLHGSEILTELTAKDFEQAEIIRHYYSKKFFWNKLKSTKEITPFRQKTMLLLSKQISEPVPVDCVGLFVRLPWFYAEDTLYDHFKKIAKLPGDSVNFEHTRVELKLAGITLRWNAKRLFENFWFTDQDNVLYNVHLLQENPLLAIFKDAIQEQNLKFLTKLENKNIEDLEFYRMYDYKIIKE